MEKVLHKCLINYYLHLKIVDNTWDETCNSVKELIRGLKNRSQQLRLVTSNEADKVEICKVEGLREKLILKIFRGIQDEVTLIANLLSRLNNINQELRNKFTRLEEARNNISLKDTKMQELINGTPVIPRLDKLLRWAKDSCDYYQELYPFYGYHGINQCMTFLDYKNEETIENLEKSFHINYFWRTKIDRIRTFTDILSKTNAH